MPFVVIAILLAAVMGGGVSLAAQDALPGDALWSFKVGVVERLQHGADIAAIQTRLQEAEALATQGKLNTSAQAKLVSNITAHAAVVVVRITDRIGAGDYASAASIATNLQATLAKGASGALDLHSLLDTASNLSAEASEKAKQ